MAITNKFYLQLADIFGQIEIRPDVLPDFSLEEWQENSQEKNLLLTLQSTIVKLLNMPDNHSTSIEKEGPLFKNIFESDCNGIVITDLENGEVV